MTIKRGTNYIKFVAALPTTANKAGETIEAWRDYMGWHCRTIGDTQIYQATANLLRTIGGVVIAQSAEIPAGIEVYK